MDARELALLFIKQMREQDQSVVPDADEPRAVYVWEDDISNDPEEAWPVFQEILSRAADDETLEQVWYRLRLLLGEHYDDFHERAAELLARYSRLANIAGPDALDPEQYREKTFDREGLIDAYRALHKTHAASSMVEHLAHTDPQRALAIAVEIIHRGAARGWDSLDLMSPLQEILAANGPRVIEPVEELARTSVAIRRVLWRLMRMRQSWLPAVADDGTQLVSPGVDADLSSRLERSVGGTTDYTERDVAIAQPVQQLDVDEQIIADWFVNQQSFWSFSAMGELVEEDPRLAWSITLDLIARADDHYELGAIAAGPLEELIRKHPDVIWAELSEKAHTDERFLAALRAVWIFEDDGDVYGRLRTLMETAGAEPN